jgi:hypothetical protein
MFAGSTTAVNEVQSRKRFLPIHSTLSGIVSVVKLLHSRNAEFSIRVTP